ncbi:MAG TPA: hypothetical protein VD973_25025 [Symbiobacteriaceae bacterium]|nr:hypothetical protein [Symbiobacteriaceae bacterium]
MMRNWQKPIGSLALGLMLSLPLMAGCGGSPAPRRPEAGSPGNTDLSGTVNVAVSEAAAAVARGVTGAGTTEVLVLGQGALAAIQLNSPSPGGTEGQPLTGRSHDVDYPGSSPGGGPVNAAGPGGAPGTNAAVPGGQTSPSTTPGGTPNYTQAVPNAMGDNATQSGSNTSAVPVPGANGAQPMAVMTRIADQIRAQTPGITEVRFATNPDDARRVADLAAAMRSNPERVSADEIRALWTRAIPAGTELFNPMYPSPGSRG